MSCKLCYVTGSVCPIEYEHCSLLSQCRPAHPPRSNLVLSPYFLFFILLVSLSSQLPLLLHTCPQFFAYQFNFSYSVQLYSLIEPAEQTISEFNHRSLGKNESGCELALPPLSCITGRAQPCSLRPALHSVTLLKISYSEIVLLPFCYRTFEHQNLNLAYTGISNSEIKQEDNFHVHNIFFWIFLTWNQVPLFFLTGLTQVGHIRVPPQTNQDLAVLELGYDSWWIVCLLSMKLHVNRLDTEISRF